jgi:RNA-binding protein YhbY
MSSTEKQHQRELRQPDPLQVRLARFLNILLSNSKVIFAMGLGIAVIVGSYYVYERIQTNIRMGRVEKLGKIHVIFANEEKKAADQRQEIQKKIEDLAPKTPAANQSPEGPLGEAPLGKLPPEKESLKKELTEKMEAVKADHSESQKQLEAFYKEYSDKPEGWAAAMLVVKIIIDQEKLSDAKTLYEELASKTQSEPFYQIQTRLGLIGLYEEQSEFDKGLSEVELLMGLMGGGQETSTTKQALYAGYAQEMMPKLLLKKAQLQIFKGAKAEAAQTLAVITEKHESSPQAQEARNLKIMVQ